MRVHAQDVTVTIDNRDVVRNASLTALPAHMTALIGPSGSGKTTLLHTLGLLLRPTSGTVLVDAETTNSWNGARRRRFWRSHAAFVLQDEGVIEDESVAFNLTMSASRFGGGVRGDHARMQQALDEVGLQDLAGEPASHLSGGEKQRLSIARAIYKNAQVVYVDEPTASLDADNRDHVISLFRARAEAGCTVILASHDQEMIDACDTTVALSASPSPIRRPPPSSCTTSRTSRRQIDDAQANSSANSSSSQPGMFT